MKKGEKKVKDALLGDEGAETPTPPASAKPVEPAPVETKDTKLNPPAPAKKLTGIKAEALAKFPNDTAAQAKFILANSEHISFLVPLGEGEKEGAFETTNINGYRLTIKKGVMVNIPIQVANLLANKYRIAMTAGSEKELGNASKDVQDALG